MVIDGKAIERAEKVLRIIYGKPLSRQLEMMEVDQTSFDSMLNYNKSVLVRRYGNAWHEMDPRLEPAINTLMAHIFLLGVVCGRESVRELA